MKKLIIIGGGFAGTQVAKSLESEFQTTLIDTKNYFEFTPSILRLVVETKIKDKIRIPHSNYLKKTKIIVDNVKEVSQKKVKLKTKSLNYDYLVIASGATYGSGSGIKAGDSQALLSSIDKLKNSKHILLIGGGLVGVELAGEIMDKYDKKITIVHSKDRVIERNHPKASKYTEKYLEDKGVKIIHNKKAKIKDSKCYLGKKQIKCDLVYICTGIKANYEFIEKNFSKNLNERNQIKVNQHLQMSDNIFVAGDVIALEEEKTAQSAEKQAKIIIQNLRNLKNKKPLEEYKPKIRPIVISLGKYNAVYEQGSFVLTGKIPALMKWFIEKKTLAKYR